MLDNKKTIIQCLFMFLLLLRDVEVSDWGETWADDVIVSENIRISRPDENAKAAFSDLSTLGPGFKK